MGFRLAFSEEKENFSEEKKRVPLSRPSVTPFISVRSLAESQATVPHCRRLSCFSAGSILPPPLLHPSCMQKLCSVHPTSSRTPSESSSPSPENIIARGTEPRPYIYYNKPARGATENLGPRRAVPPWKLPAPPSSSPPFPYPPPPNHHPTPSEIVLS